MRFYIAAEYWEAEWVILKTAEYKRAELEILFISYDFFNAELSQEKCRQGLRSGGCGVELGGCKGNYT